jgi:hypothetical protein
METLKEVTKKLKLKLHARNMIPLLYLAIVVVCATNVGFVACYPTEPVCSHIAGSEIESADSLSESNNNVSLSISASNPDSSHMEMSSPSATLSTTHPTIEMLPPVINELIETEVTENNDPIEQLEASETEPSVFVEHGIVFLSVNETCYTHGTINVRSGPGKKYSVVDKVPPGTAVTRLGQGEYGWDQIVYNGEIVYAWHELLH